MVFPSSGRREAARTKERTKEKQKKGSRDRCARSHQGVDGGLRVGSEPESAVSRSGRADERDDRSVAVEFCKGRRSEVLSGSQASPGNHLLTRWLVVWQSSLRVLVFRHFRYHFDIGGVCEPLLSASVISSRGYWFEKAYLEIHRGVHPPLLVVLPDVDSKQLKCIQILRQGVPGKFEWSDCFHSVVCCRSAKRNDLREEVTPDSAAGGVAAS